MKQVRCLAFAVIVFCLTIVACDVGVSFLNTCYVGFGPVFFSTYEECKGLMFSTRTSTNRHSRDSMRYARSTRPQHLCQSIHSAEILPSLSSRHSLCFNHTVAPIHHHPSNSSIIVLTVFTRPQERADGARVRARSDTNTTFCIVEILRAVSSIEPPKSTRSRLLVSDGIVFVLPINFRIVGWFVHRLSCLFLPDNIALKEIWRTRRSTGKSDWLIGSQRL